MRVARTDKSLAHHNTLVLRKLKVFFQRFPGTAGADADRGIGDADYTVKVDGRVVDKGKTAADGSITLRVPAGAACTLSLLGTDFAVTMHGFMEPVTATKGLQRRLQMGGYNLGAVDGTIGARTDKATLDLQADGGLDPDGVSGNQTQTQLKTLAGE
jgi:hypothetical protein